MTGRVKDDWFGSGESCLPAPEPRRRRGGLSNSCRKGERAAVVERWIAEHARHVIGWRRAIQIDVGCRLALLKTIRLI